LLLAGWAVVAWLPASCPAHQVHTVYADDPRISYGGRVAGAGLGASSFARLSWPATRISVTFSGSWLAANISGSTGSLWVGRGDAFLVEVDGVAVEQAELPGSSGCCSLVVPPGWQHIVLVENLTHTDHTLTLWKLTEESALLNPLNHEPNPATSFASFASFTSDGEFLPAAAAPPRRLLFLGDSDTAGYCAAGSPATSPLNTLRYTENTQDGWAVQLAALLGAEPVVEAVSGVGVASTLLVPGGLATYWRRSLPALPVLHWDPAAWAPHAVLLLIGPNDDLSDEAGFTSAYLGLLEEVAAAYSGQSSPPALIQVCGGSGKTGLDPCPAIQLASMQFNRNRTDGFSSNYVSISPSTWAEINSQQRYLGCSGHYNRAGHTRLATEILPQVQQVLGW